MTYDTHGYRVFDTACAVGFVACGLGLVATTWATTGSTPAWVYGTFEDLSTFRTNLLVLGVPIEFAWLVGFGLLALLRLWGGAPSREWRSLACLGLAIILTGTSGAVSLSRGFHSATADCALLAASLVLVVVGVGPMPGPRTALCSLARSLHDTHVRRYMVLLAAAVYGTVLVGASLRVALSSTSLDRAALLNFVNWYSSRTQHGPDAGSGTVDVSIFTDYACPACASLVPKVQSAVAALATRAAVPVAVQVHDFPLDTPCNPGLRMSLHPDACEAAAAVRLLQERLGPAAASEAAAALYHRRAQTVTGTVNDILMARGLAKDLERDRARLLDLVARDARAGLALGVRSTPAFFVNRTRIRRAAFVKAAVQFELQRAEKERKLP